MGRENTTACGFSPFLGTCECALTQDVKCISYCSPSPHDETAAACGRVMVAVRGRPDDGRSRPRSELTPGKSDFWGHRLGGAQRAGRVQVPEEKKTGVFVAPVPRLCPLEKDAEVDGSCPCASWRVSAGPNGPERPRWLRGGPGEPGPYGTSPELLEIEFLGPSKWLPQTEVELSFS